MKFCQTKINFIKICVSSLHPKGTIILPSGISKEQFINTYYNYIPSALQNFGKNLKKCFKQDVG